jgi:hypothetical protein
MPNVNYPLNVFVSYSHKDEKYKNEFVAFLVSLQREQKIKIWHDRMILPGDKWDDLIREKLRTSEIVFFLISVDFLNSSYIWENELPAAIERQKSGLAKLIPIYLRPVDDLGVSFSEFQGLPRDHYNGNFISNFNDREDAYLKIAREIRSLVENWNANN